MKRIFIMSFFALLFIQACKKDQELIDNKKPEERVAEAINKYKNELINSANGWVATLKTSAIQGSYSFYMKFGKESRVTMLSDYDEDFALETVESTYRLKYVMAPSIIFDTYNVLHLLQDPNPESFEGEYGVGYGSDFEFEIREQVGDTLKLLGKKRQTELILVKATAEDAAFYDNGELATSITGINKYLKDNPYLYIPDVKDNANRIQVSIGTGIQSRSISLTSALHPDISSQNTLSFNSAGLLLGGPLKFGDIIYTSIAWDVTAKKLFLVSTTGARIEILPAPSPIIPLHFLIGTNYTTITAPNATTYEGWSADYISRRASTAASLAGAYGLGLENMSYVFNALSKKVVLTVGIPQAGTAFVAVFNYDYSKTDDGIFKFTYTSAGNGNATLITPLMAKLLAERFNTDTFTLEYAVNPSTGALLGKFKSVEHTDFTFTGILR